MGSTQKNTQSIKTKGNILADIINVIEITFIITFAFFMLLPPANCTDIERAIWKKGKSNKQLFTCSNWFILAEFSWPVLLNNTVNNDLHGISKQIRSGFD